MRKIKDRIILGAITGLIVSPPFQIIDALIHKRGITDVPYGYSASKIFLTKKATKTPASKVMSVVINIANSGLVATSIVYTLSLTGKDKALIKGAGVGTMMWVGVAGLFSNVVLNVKSKRPITPLISLVEHVLFGSLCSYVITKLGDDSLFPDKEVKNQKNIPVVYTGND